MKITRHNCSELKATRQILRAGLTPAEARLWSSLQNSRLDGRKFRRQPRVGNYILDFYCPSERRAVELDGQGHYTVASEASDLERTNYLQNAGTRVVRFENQLVFEQTEWVLAAIRQAFRPAASF